MSAINILADSPPKKGQSIPTGTFEYAKCPAGRPAMKIRWKGRLFSGEPEWFDFATQTELFIPMAPHEIKLFVKGKRRIGPLSQMHAPGLANILTGAVSGIANMALDAALDAKNPTDTSEGFGIRYRNPEGEIGAFMAIAPREIVTEIVRCIPAERRSDQTNPPELRKRQDSDEVVDAKKWNPKWNENGTAWVEGETRQLLPNDIVLEFGWTKGPTYGRGGYAIERNGRIIAEHVTWLS